MKTIIQILSKGANGGVESIIMNYCKLLYKDFHFIFFIENESKIINKKTISEINGELFLIPSYKHIFKYIHELNQIFSSRNDISIVHSNLSTMSFLPLWLAKKAHIPIRISEAHSTDSKKEILRSSLKQLFKHFTNHYLTERFACSLLAAEFQYGKNYVNSDKVFILPNAIDLNRFIFSEEKRMQLRIKLGIEKKDFVIGNIGRFVKQKNQKFLIDVLSQLSRNQSVKLVFIGSGELEKEIKKEVEKRNIQDRVIFIAPIQNIEDYYNIFDIFCLPSLYEGLPIVAIEAQANGLPVLLSDTITKECRINQNVYFLKNTSIKSWEDSITRIREQKNTRQIKLSDFEPFNIYIQKEKLKRKYNELLNHINS